MRKVELLFPTGGFKYERSTMSNIGKIYLVCIFLILPIHSQETKDFFRAVSSGNLESVKNLLEEGVDVNEYSEEGETALTIAIEKKNYALVKLLIDNEATCEYEELELAMAKSAKIASLLMRKGVQGCTSLMTAVYQGNIEATKSLLANDADVNEENENEETALMFARKKKIIDILLEHGADIEKENASGKTALMLAIEKGRKQAFRALLARGANVHIKTNDWKTSIEMAIDHGHSEMEKVLVAQKANKWTALMVASYKGDASQVKNLLENGVDVEATSEDYETPLLVSVKKQWNQEVFDALLDSGTDINQSDLDEYNVLMNALIYLDDDVDAAKHIVSKNIDLNAENDSGDCAMAIALNQNAYRCSEFLASETGWTQLMIASHQGDSESIEEYFEYGEIKDLNEKNKMGQTALMLATTIETIDVLARNGADTNARDKKDRSALLIAIRKEETDLINTLLDYDMNISSKDGAKALMYAISTEDTYLVDRLLDKKVDIDFGEFDEIQTTTTPLIWAISKESTEMVEYLIKRGAKLNHVPKINPNSILANSGKNPLLFAIRQKNIEMVELLINLGADIQVRDSQNETVLMQAVDAPEILKLLIEKGADVNAKAVYNLGFGNTDQQPLFSAIAVNNLESVKILLKAGAKVDSRRWDKRTPLMEAAAEMRNNDGIVKALIAAGADVNALDEHGYTPLRYAVMFDNKLEVVKALVAKGANVTSSVLDEARRNNNNEIIAALQINAVSPLSRAAIEGNLSKVKALIISGEKIDEQGSEGRTALIWAAAHGHTEIVTALIQAKANMNIQDKDKNTPLMRASKNGHTSVVKALVKAGANVHIKTPYYNALSFYGNAEIAKILIAQKIDVNVPCPDINTVLLKAIYANDVALVKMLIKFGADLNHRSSKQTPLMIVKNWISGEEDSKEMLGVLGPDLPPLIVAVIEQNIKKVSQLIAAGAQINSTDEEGKTPLIWACDKANREIVKILIKAGANVNAQSKSNASALLFTAEDKIVKDLIKAGANVNIQDKDGNTALINAARNGNNEIIKILIQEKANVNFKTVYGDTALILAIKADRIEIEAIKDIISANADVNVQDESKNTALMYAAAEGNIEAMKLLLAAKADVNLQDEDGFTALVHAFSRGNIEGAKLLIAAKTNVNIQEEDGSTVLMHAASQGDVEATKLLIAAKANVNMKNADDDTALTLAANEEIKQLLKEAGAE